MGSPHYSVEIDVEVDVDVVAATAVVAVARQTHLAGAVAAGAVAETVADSPCSVVSFAGAAVEASRLP